MSANNKLASASERSHYPSSGLPEWWKCDYEKYIDLSEPNSAVIGYCEDRLEELDEYIECGNQIRQRLENLFYNHNEEEGITHLQEYQDAIDDWNYNLDNEHIIDDLDDGYDEELIQQNIDEMIETIERLNNERLFQTHAFAIKRNIEKSVQKIEKYYLNAKYNPRTQIGEKFVNKLYDENF